jgi:hypothetical protein
MTATLEEANTKMRQAVRERLDNTDPADDKLVGYRAPPLAGCEPAQQCAAEVLAQAWGESCCEGQRLRGDSLLENRKHPSSTAFVALLQEMQRLHESKSADYGSEEDPLANVRSGADFVNIEPWRGCMVRIADKVQRLRTFCRTGRLVHEGVRDTLLDLSAYALLAIVLFDEGKGG